MKFYEKIIGINKDAPTTELKITFSENGFEFDNNLYLNKGRTLSLKGNNESVIFFRNSYTAIADLDDALHFGGSGRGIYFNFESGTIWSSNVDWSLGSSSKPLNNIYSTNAHFNNILSSTITADTVDIADLNITSTNGNFNNIPSSIINADTVNVTDLTFTSTNPVILPKNFKIRVFDGEELDIAGAEILTITPAVGIKYWNNTGDLVSTSEEVTWKGITTRANGKACIQFFATIDVDVITGPYSALWIPSPFANEPVLVRDILQLSYRDSGSYTNAPSIREYWENPFWVDWEHPIYYLKVDNAYLLGDLFIQITRFTDIL